MPDSRHFLVEFLRLARQFWCSEHKRTIRGAALLLAALTMLQMVMAVLLNRWSAGLFNALEQHSMTDLLTQVGKLAILFVCGIVLTGSHLFVKRNLMIYWRDWMTEHVFTRWMKDGAHYLISHLPGEHDNPDGRIAEDCRIATESAVGMAHSLFYSILMLVGFTQVLWSLSGVVTSTSDLSGSRLRPSGLDRDRVRGDRLLARLAGEPAPDRRHQPAAVGGGEFPRQSAGGAGEQPGHRPDPGRGL